MCHNIFLRIVFKKKKKKLTYYKAVAFSPCAFFFLVVGRIFKLVFVFRENASLWYKAGSNKTVSNIDCLHNVHQRSCFPCNPFSWADFRLAEIPLVAQLYRKWDQSQRKHWLKWWIWALTLFACILWEDYRSSLKEFTPCLSHKSPFAVVTTGNKNFLAKWHTVFLSCVKGNK